MFCPPEMFSCQEINPFKADIWALGITFFYMITENYPFKSKSRDELIALISKGEIKFDKYKVHPKILFLIIKMTTKDQHNRPTADKLLKSPLYTANRRYSFTKSQTNTNASISSYQTQTSISLNKSLTFELDTNEVQDTHAIKRHDTQPTLIHMYKSFNPQKKNQRINGRFISVKKT